MLAAERQIQALATGIADVAEVAAVGSGRDKLDIVAVEGVEDVGTPGQALGGRASQAQLYGARDHLLQVGVAGKVVGQPARRRRIGAAELDHGRPARLVVVGARVSAAVGVSVKPSAGFRRLKV